MVNLIDTHSHIFVDDFVDLEQVMQNAKNAGVDWILMPNIDVESIESVKNTHLLYPNQTKMMMGLHPCSVTKDYKTQLATIHEELKNLACCAVGEIGLDYYWSQDLIKEQQQALEIQLQWAIDHKLPVSLHTRDATQETIDICKNFKGLKGVFHCFGGNVHQATEIIEMGMYLGIGGVVTFKNSGLEFLIDEIGIDQLVLETDAPYLAPVPYRGKRNEPGYLKIIAEKISDITFLDITTVAKTTTANAKKIFNL